jgi:hypothetical protein
MGQHTFFYKDANTLREKVALEQRLNSLIEEHGFIFPPAEVVIEMNAINDKIDQLDENENLTRDLFRTGKRNPDGTYYEKDLLSKEEVFQFMEENKETIFYFDKEGFDQFWEKNPNGAVRLQ